MNEKQKKAAEEYKKLSFTSDFIFWKVMTTRLDLCKEILEMILDHRISKIVYPEGQKTIDLSLDGKSVRLDVYLEGSDEVYNLEMQTTQKDPLGKRTRYYQGMIDLDLLEKGAKYQELRMSYIIFICTFDPYGKKLPIYTFESRCKELPDLALADESIKIFVNGDATEASGKMGEFIKFLSGEVTGELSEKLEQAVTDVKGNKQFRRDYMTLYARYEEKKEEGRVEGRVEGRISAIASIISNGASKEDVLGYGFSEEEYEQAAEQLLTHA